MLDTLLFLETSFLYNGPFGSLFSKWEQLGVFDFLLPFLIIFCLIFIVLNGLKIFKENRVISAIIALAVGMLAMSFDFVPVFFREVFPRLGIGLGVILVILVLLGLFAPVNQKWFPILMFAFATLIAILVLVNTAGELSWSFLGAWDIISEEFWAFLAMIILLAVVIGASSKTDDQPSIEIPLTHPAS